MIDRRMKIVKYHKLIILAFATICISPVQAIAKEDKEQPLEFSVQAIRPDTQIETNKTYFVIETKPNESQVLHVKVKAAVEEPIKVQVSLLNGTTGIGGNIEYDPLIKDVDETLKNPITEIAKVSQTEITLENFEEKTVDIVVTPPNDSYEGIKLGAIVFNLAEEEDSTKKKSMVENAFQYRIGLITSETNEDYDNAKNLDLISTKADLTLGRKQISAVIHNSDPKIADNLNIEATVKKKGSSNVLKRQAVTNARMAPNSTYDFLIDWGAEDIKAGDYVVDMKAKNEQDEWKWQSEFTISEGYAKKLNEETVFKLESPKWLPFVVVATILIIVGVTTALIIRNARWKQILKERMKRRRAKKARKRKEKGDIAKRKKNKKRE
ncbi:hypothetical protein A5881_003175 [Enterococcus termitis]